MIGLDGTMISVMSGESSELVTERDGNCSKFSNAEYHPSPVFRVIPYSFMIAPTDPPQNHALSSIHRLNVLLSLFHNSNQSHRLLICTYLTSHRRVETLRGRLRKTSTPEGIAVGK